MSTDSIIDSFQQVNANTWVIGKTILLRREISQAASSWSDGHGQFFTISEPNAPAPQGRAMSNVDYIQLVHHIGENSAVWRIGEAYLKVKTVENHNATREHTTLGFVQSKNPATFDTPTVIHHHERDGRYFVFLSRMVGETIAEAWWHMDENTKDRHVGMVIDACKELASWKGSAISGVDGLHLSEERLTGGNRTKTSPESLLENCKAMGMDCSVFLFFHCDMGPGNVIVNRANGRICIIDWETAGYVPKEWIRTKFRISMGLNLPGRDDDSKNDWRRRIQQQLGNEGFADVADAWMMWSKSKGQA